MNLIGNCCISNCLEREYGLPHSNPFTWIDFDFNSMYHCITNWNHINWCKVSLEKHKHPYQSAKDIYWLVVDNKIKLRYVHYLFDPHAIEPITNNVDVAYCKIWEYIISQYTKRVCRMLHNDEPPTVIVEWGHLDYDYANWIKLQNSEFTYKMVVISYDASLETSKHNILLIHDPHKHGNDPKGCPPSWFAHKYKDQIYKFITK